MTAEPLHRLVQSTQFTDQEIRRLAANASKEADKIMKGLEGAQGIGARAASARAAMGKVTAQLWADVGDVTKIGIGDAVWNATEMQALYDEKMFSAAGMSARYWRQSLIATAQQGVQSLISRKENGITLSDRVYKNAALSKGYVDRAINSGLLLGKSPKAIADDVVGFINPNVPGGASYAAMRLGRSEVNNAFHQTSVRGMQNTPWVERAQWHLSGSHPRPDECNQYADDVHFKGGEPGQFKVSEVPSKPHPNCLCYVTPVMMDLDKFAKRFQQGQFDQYVEQTQGCWRVA